MQIKIIEYNAEAILRDWSVRFFISVNFWTHTTLIRAVVPKRAFNVQSRSKIMKPCESIRTYESFFRQLLRVGTIEM
jgi:hypothetical protein